MGTPDTPPHAEAPDDDGSIPLSFVDLLYAVPVADLATRLDGTPLSTVTATGWAAVALALAAITFGWVGHHTNRKHLPSSAKLRERTWPFTTARFPQFIVEILIIGAYFALVTLADPSHDAEHGSSFELAKAGWLTGVFGLYLVWDALDVRIASTLRETAWEARARQGMAVTALFAVAFAIVLGLTLASPHHRLLPPVWFDVLAIVVLYAYRATQELRHGGRSKRFPKEV